MSVEIRNENYHAIAVYAVRTGGRMPVGRLESNQSDTFELLWPEGDTNFLVDFFAVGCVFVEGFHVGHDDELLLVVQAADHQDARRDLCEIGKATNEED